jgi:hypothetical protein
MCCMRFMSFVCFADNPAPHLIATQCIFAAQWLVATADGNGRRQRPAATANSATQACRHRIAGRVRHASRRVVVTLAPAMKVPEFRPRTIEN